MGWCGNWCDIQDNLYATSVTHPDLFLCHGIFFPFDTHGTLLQVFLYGSRCFLLCIHVPKGSVFCLRGNVCLAVPHLACFLIVFHLLGGVGLHRSGCRTCVSQLVVGSGWLGRKIHGGWHNVFLRYTPVRIRLIFVILSMSSSLEGRLL